MPPDPAPPCIRRHVLKSASPCTARDPETVAREGEPRTVAPSPDYTFAALAMGLVNLLWVVAVIWALFGLPAVMALGCGLNLGIDRLRR